MLFFLDLFLLFVYFKIARVHKKEEKLSFSIKLQHILVALSALSLFSYAYSYIAWYLVLIVSFLFFIIAALIVTAVQLGIFVDGKPQFGISKLYQYLPLITITVTLLSAIIWS